LLRCRHLAITEVYRRWYRESVFKNGHFHADLHSGNMFIEFDEWKSEFYVTIIDAGSKSKFDEEERAAFRKLVIHSYLKCSNGIIEALDKLLPGKIREVDKPSRDLFRKTVSHLVFNHKINKNEENENGKEKNDANQKKNEGEFLNYLEPLSNFAISNDLGKLTPQFSHFNRGNDLLDCLFDLSYKSLNDHVEKYKKIYENAKKNGIEMKLPEVSDIKEDIFRGVEKKADVLKQLFVNHYRNRNFLDGIRLILTPIVYPSMKKLLYYGAIVFHSLKKLLYYGGIVLVSLLIFSQIYRMVPIGSNHISSTQQSSEKLLLLPSTSMSLRDTVVIVMRYVYLHIVENEDAAESVSNKVLLLQ